MAAFARLLECLLWSARKEQEAEEEEEEGRRTHDGPRSLLDAPRCFQRPHGGAAASWGLRFGASAVQGWRAHMEDAHCAWLALPGLPPGWAFFAVLDGHGGARAALFGARHLPGHVFEALGTAPDEPEGVRGALRRAFLNADARLRALWPRGEPGGSTAVALLVSPRFLYLAHCGDSRAMLSRAGAVAFSTEDHRPLRPRERERIHNAGGTIRRRRLEGSLAVSRALGDFAYKEAPGRPPELQLVSAEPEVTALARQAEDEFMLLASDGVWDAMSGAALARLVASRLCLGLAPELLCAQLLDTCLCKGSLDNMTCVLVCFPGAPRPCEEAIRKELALDAALGRRVSGEQAPKAQREGWPVSKDTPIILASFSELYSSAQEPPSLNTVFRTLASEDIPDLPPGGGLYCKVAVIAEAYSRLCQASGGRWQKGPNGARKPTGTHSNSSLDLEA
ncbi:probable protein phosphatase 1N isoform X1 [Acinonyx jubatus]|uniref:protein-serine/threonine phosphatase n=1 Tax=Acinonyx jubatus TaxID=32536 RepID=A0A6J1XM51_ACIJB|nr:probable protein phosphatase 1N isoform X1 [Acinonyx jubatus]